ncbi:hypothetical protein [Fulvivirga imtechensis]|uniref:hypothetical protein n=1 Tax=Fulvivirga imtechensis TaxID=881893 RepID=UPI0012F79BAA|nr:hypothetical protein [Fulvivirga imtechensis]
MTQITDDLQDANTGGYMPSFAEKLFELTGKQTYVSENAEGGSEFSPYLDNNNWSQSGNLYAPMVAEAESFETYLGRSIDVIIMILGINDARGDTSLATIESDAFDLIDRLAVDFPDVPVMIVQRGRMSGGSYASDPQWIGVGEIITNGVDGLVETYSHVHLAEDLSDTDEYPISTPAAYYDSLHLTQEYNNKLGENLAIFYANNIMQ